MGANLLFLTICVTTVICQRKTGDCPPKIKMSECNMTCYNDRHCKGEMKCCRTSCDGTTCVDPVTQRAPDGYIIKVGYCPRRRTGSWVCTDRCSLDGDCGRGIKKCCKNRCGAMACTFPQARPF